MKRLIRLSLLALLLPASGLATPGDGGNDDDFEVEADRHPKLKTGGTFFLQDATLLTVSQGTIEHGSIFVKNGSSAAGLGAGGEGFTSFSIAGWTGEGLTTARTFTRSRRCALVDYFRIV